MREVQVRCTWESVHTIEVPDEAGPFDSGDLEGVLEASDGDDVTSSTADLVDWDVKDRRR